MNCAVLSLGSNKGDRLKYITNTELWLRETFNHVLYSDIYELPAINGHDRSYLNAVVAIYTDNNMEEVITKLKDWETRCGRTPSSKLNGTIPIDIDVVIWNDTITRPREYTFEYFAKGYRQLTDRSITDK